MNFKAWKLKIIYKKIKIFIKFFLFKLINKIKINKIKNWWKKRKKLKIFFFSILFFFSYKNYLSPIFNYFFSFKRYDAMQILRDDARMLSSRLKETSKSTFFNSYRSNTTSTSPNKALMELSARSFMSLIVAGTSEDGLLDSSSSSDNNNDTNMIIDQWFILLNTHLFWFNC